MKENIVIGIEGLVGCGKTSICKKLLDLIPNSIILHAGNIYRAIVYRIATSGIPKEELKDIHLEELFKKFNIEIKIEDRETVVYSNGEKISEEILQSPENSIAVSKVSRVADNSKAYLLVRHYIDEFRKKYNVIFSGRDTKRIYPDLTCHIMLTADIEKRVEWKSGQYEGIDKEELKNQINLRDELQRESGYYDTFEDTIVLDLSHCNTVDEKVDIVYNAIKNRS